MLAFLLSPLGKIAAVLVLAIAILSGVFLAGHKAGAQGVELRVEREVAAERARQQAIALAATEAALVRDIAARAALAENEKRADELTDELAARDAEMARLAAAEPEVCRCSTNPALSPGDAGALNAIR